MSRNFLIITKSGSKWVDFSFKNYYDYDYSNKINLTLKKKIIQGQILAIKPENKFIANKKRL